MIDHAGARWRRLRATVLRRDGYRCRECARYGKRVDATTAHHVWPEETHPDLAWRSQCLISLCSSCHDAMHDRGTRCLTARGLAWQRRLPPPSTW